MKLDAGPAGGATRMITVRIQCGKIAVTQALNGLIEAQKRLKGRRPSFANLETAEKEAALLRT